MRAQVTARAKINLALHVLGRHKYGDHKGYHMLDSLAVFANLCDDLTIVTQKSRFSGGTLKITGEFAATTPQQGNLITRAIRFLSPAARHKVEITVTKRIPPAGGLGGASSDAAATLKALAKMWRLPIAQQFTNIHHHPWLARRIGYALGADIPVCLANQPMRIGGMGEKLAKIPALPPFPVLLVNPRISCQTAQVFSQCGEITGNALPPLPKTTSNQRQWVEYLKQCRNDLEIPAQKLHPEIQTVLTQLRACRDCQLARMSGSGASCFAIFPTSQAVVLCQKSLQRQHPKWWFAATEIA